MHMFISVDKKIVATVTKGVGISTGGSTERGFTSENDDEGVLLRWGTQSVLPTPKNSGPRNTV